MVPQSQIPEHLITQNASVGSICSAHRTTVTQSHPPKCSKLKRHTDFSLEATGNYTWGYSKYGYSRWGYSKYAYILYPYLLYPHFRYVGNMDIVNMDIVNGDRVNVYIVDMIYIYIYI